MVLCELSSTIKIVSRYRIMSMSGLLLTLTDEQVAKPGQGCTSLAPCNANFMHESHSANGIPEDQTSWLEDAPDDLSSQIPAVERDTGNRSCRAAAVGVESPTQRDTAEIACILNRDRTPDVHVAIAPRHRVVVRV